MPYYAVSFQEHSGYLTRKANDEDVKQWQENHPGEPTPENLVIKTGHWHGSHAKVQGPFKKPEQAWNAAVKFQSRSMRSGDPFVFKYGKNQSLNSLTKKIEYDEYRTTKYAIGKHCIDKIVFVK